MNWTGGQLQRHHTRSGLLTKTQKQNFAKSRLQKGTGIPPPSPFRNFPDIGPFKTSTRDKSVEVDIEGNQVTEEPITHVTEGQSSQRAKALSEVKRRLLKEPDWAAVAATRPLKIAFPSVEDIERFGKRRRLNDNDRRRLVPAKHNGATFFELPTPQRRARNSSSVIASIENIHIEINGRPVAQPNDGSGMAMDSISSQSMLLDHEGSSIVEQDMEKENQTATWITNLFPR